MATIIEFYIPKSFRGRPARIPSQGCGKVLPFRAGHTENTLTRVHPVPMLRIMAASEGTDKTSSEGDHFPTARNFELRPARAKESLAMPVPKQPVPKQNVWQHENQYTADSACSHCSGVDSHEPWCSTTNSNVRYAFQAVLYPDRLTIQDGLILHALGAVWEGKNR